ncbi:MAG: nucleotidyltransferase family protein [Terrisporobacter sp.]
MKVLAIIAEYNPMHNGHIYHIQKAKEITKSDFVILVISGSFTMTGNISILDKFTKAKIALQYGVDLVIELPTIYATSSSQYFAKGAINLLNSLNIVGYICFGVECENIALLKSVANKINENEDKIWKDIQSENKNINFAKSRSNVLAKYLNINELTEINKPNNILAIEYLKELNKLKSNIQPYCIKRNNKYISSTNIRKYLSDNNFKEIENNVPTLIYDKLLNNEFVLNNEIFKLLRYKINSMSLDELKNINEVTEGLENRIKKYAITSKSYEDLLENIKTKRYIENKIKRIFINILLNITKDKFNLCINNNLIYAHILAFNDKGAILLSNMHKLSKMPILTSINDNILSKLDSNIQYLINLDIYSTNVHSVITNKITNTDYTNKL